MPCYSLDTIICQQLCYVMSLKFLLQKENEGILNKICNKTRIPLSFGLEYKICYKVTMIFVQRKPDFTKDSLEFYHIISQSYFGAQIRKEL